MNEEKTKQTDIKVKESPPIKIEEASQTMPKKGVKLGQMKLIQNMKERFKANKFYLNLNPKTKKIIKIFGISFGILIIVLVFLAIVFRIQKGKKENLPTPTPKEEESQEEEVIRNPSRYATDSAVLKIEEKVLEMDKKLRDVDLKESALRPPPIEYDINFE